MNRSLRGRADLLRALASDVPRLGAAMAELLGYREEPGVGPAPPVVIFEPEPLEDSSARSASVYAPAQVPFWRLDAFEAVAPVPLPAPLPDVDAPVWLGRPTVMPDGPRLAPKRTVLTQLRDKAAVRRESRDIDVEAVVERLGNGRLLDRLPYRQRRAWGTSMCLVTDRARRLLPYWRDQDDLAAFLKQLYLPEGWTEAWIDGNVHRPFVFWPEAQYGHEVSPAPGSMVLVLGDLGCLARQGESVRGFWRQWGRQLREQGIPAVALVRAQATAMPPDLTQIWTIVPWGSSEGAAAEASSSSTADIVQRLLTLLSPAARVEPGLLRTVRCLLPEGRRDPGLEARVWQDPAIASPQYVAASWLPEQRRVYLARFAEQPKALRRAALEAIRTWRATLSPALWFEEIIGLDPQSRQALIGAADREDAVRYLTRLADSLEQSKQIPVDTAAWIVGLADCLPEEIKHDPRVQRAVHRLYELVRPRAVETQAPGWYDPAVVSSPDLPVRQVELWHLADQLVVQTVEQPPVVHGSRLGLMCTASGEMVVTPGEAKDEKGQVRDLNRQPRLSIALPKEGSFRINTDRDRLRFGRLTKPEWASEIGRDNYGLWVTFEVSGVRQRMCWIPPGRFWMGSPKEEEGRFDDEGPRREVQLSHGFWLFDTPCTQALWQVVMKKNPSRFKGKDGKERPVEQVSWEDCRQFIAKLNAQLPRLASALPTEAEWEYACRAGTDSARYADNLDTIAWYRENSNEETHPIKQKQPNAWGLYDMLGNVEEWCHDGRRPYTTDPVVDPLGPTTAGAIRVVRGGFWSWGARFVRSAYRHAGRPGFRDEVLGFRCASSGQASRLESEPRGDGRRSGARAVGDRADRRRPVKRGE